MSRRLRGVLSSGHTAGAHQVVLPEAISQDLYDDLVALLGADRVRVDGAERALLRRDASLFDSGVAGPICFPLNTTEGRRIPLA